MKRLTWGTWIGSIALFGVPVSVLEGQTPGAGTPAADARTARPRSVVETGIDSHLKGEYEAAEVMFVEADKYQQFLSAEEKAKLVEYKKRNSEALTGRRAALQQLVQADQLVAAGKVKDADPLLKALRASKYLNAEERQQVMRLSETQKQKGNPRRGFMDWGNKDSAAQAAQSGKPDADAVMAEARRAFERGEYDQAETLAKEAQQAGHSSVFPWSDTPAKVMKDVNAARAKMGTAVVGPAVPGTKPATTATPDGKVVQAHELLRQAQQAAHAGDTVTARKLVADAEALKANIPWWSEHTPDKVKQEIVKAEQAKGVKPVVAVTTPTEASPPAKLTVAETKALVKQARLALEKNDYDRAETLAKQARVQPAVKYGLFEDTPDKVLAEAIKARDSGKGDRAAELLADARRKLEAGQYDEAEKMTYQAEAMRPSYPIWHRGDRPAPLRAEIVAKQKSSQKTKLPPLLDPVATKPMTPPKYAITNTPPADVARPNVAAVDPNKLEAARLVAQARECLNRADYPSALVLAGQAKMKAVAFAAGEDSPEAILAAVQAVQASKADRTNPVAAEAAKKQALQLVADARLLQKDGRLVEALQYAQQAKKIGAAYGPMEEAPDVVMAELRLACEAQMKTYSDAANTLVARGQHPEAERYWRYVFQLGTAYGCDTTGIGEEIAKVQKLSAGTASASNGPLGEGEKLLAEAEKELENGDLVKARQSANVLYTGPFNMKDKARDVMARIDDAEHKALEKRTNTAYELGRKAYLRKDYAVAASYLQSIDIRLLDDAKRAHAQELLSSREMQPVKVVQATETPTNDDRPKTTVTDQQPGPINEPKSPVMVDDVRKRQVLELERLRREAIQSQAQANKLAGSGDLDGAVDTLQTAIVAVKSSNLDSDQASALLRQLEDRYKKYSLMKEQAAFSTLQKTIGRSRMDEHQGRILFEESKKEQVADFMKKYANYMKEGKYNDAYVMAMKAHELDPDHPATENAMWRANIMRNQADDTKIQAMKGDGFGRGMRDVARASIPSVDDTTPVAYPENFKSLSDRRKAKHFQVQPVTPLDREVTSKLNTVISVDFKNKPLVDVLNELRTLTNVNIVPDMPFIDADGLSLEQPVSIKLDGLPLKTVMTRLLHNAKMTYAVRDGVLLITTPAGQRGKLIQFVHPVADLISATDRFQAPDPAATSLTGLKGLTDSVGGSSPVSWKKLNGPGAGESMADANTPQAAPGKPQRRPGQSMEELLMRLIKDTIEPASWDEMGGSGHIDYYPLGMSLIVSQTPDIQEQIQQLLERLRELQDLQVTVEVRFITLTEEFYERIGIDFDIELNDKQTRFDRMVAANTFAAPGLLNEPDHLDNVIVGLTNVGNFTSDLDIPINASSFNLATPPFGGFPNSPGANGGLDMGVAFLSSIEVYLFMEAAQGDRRSNVMTAPKITLFNGQTASLTSSTEQFFVVNVIPITNPFTGFTTFLPVNQPFPTQVSLTVQAVVTADRRYVQLTLQPFITRTRTGGTFSPVPGITLQQPTIDILTVGTTVSVPDGGTILMGGLKTMSEGRNEFGPPILSKIPYINRLFRNSGYGREATSLMIMVTPRIIIPEEEEERLGQTFAF